MAFYDILHGMCTMRPPSSPAVCQQGQLARNGHAVASVLFSGEWSPDVTPYRLEIILFLLHFATPNYYLPHIFAYNIHDIQ